ncbi:MAG: AarF/ABC1/UbiB kinase family protein [Methyloprofundus sp.]|nr:AarF/ABC1/UbiB kinase family protein [Methyloprofundus sp.]
MLIRPRYFRRYRQIVEILADYGFGAFLAQMGMSDRLNIPRWWRRRRDIPGDALTNPRRLRRVLEELGPTFIKFGQILSTRSDIMPPEYLEELSFLQDEVPPVSWDEARQVVETELGAPVEDLFAQVDPVPIASASLAQVHVAHLVGGEEVVIKIQRPNIEKTVNLDLDIIYDLARTAQQRISAASRFEVRDLAEEFASALRTEMDFRREAWNADRLRKNFADEPHLYVPKIYWDYSTQRLLVMERIRGIKINDLDGLKAAGYDPQRLSAHAANFALKEILEDGFFHADPHPGNCFYLSGNRIAFIDFGMVGRLSLERREQVLNLMRGLINKDSRRVVKVLLQWSTQASSHNKESFFLDIDGFIDQYHDIPIKELNITELLNNLTTLLRDHQLNLPADLSLLFKAFITLDGLGRQLDPEFNLVEVASPLIQRIFLARYSPDAFLKRGKDNLFNVAELLTDLPQDLHQFMESIRQGTLGVKIDINKPDWLSKELDRTVNRLSVSLVTSALIVGSSIVSTVEGGTSSVFGLMGFIGAFAGGVWLLFSIWRSG